MQCRGEEEYRARKRLTAVSNPKKAINSEHADIMYPSAIPFVLVHLAYIAALWTGITWRSVWICAVLYWLSIFAIGAGYHRYFSHRTYATSRAFQFALAVLSQSTAQKSVLWWAKHRRGTTSSIGRMDSFSTPSAPGSVRMQQACREFAAVGGPPESFWRVDLDQFMAALAVRRFAQTGEGAVG
jgi:hypothetical protein